MESSDGTIVRRVLDGDVEQYRFLVERYRAQFGRYALAVVGDRDAAQDAMQEAFIRAFDALATCRNPDRFGAWFFRILANQCRNQVARRRDVVALEAMDPARRGARRRGARPRASWPPRWRPRWGGSRRSSVRRSL